jgi:nitrogen fixation NifU-like protein
MSTKDLYQELILDHGNSPKNRKQLDSFNKEIEAFSPLCGDKVHIYMRINDENVIEDLSFTGDGCAICIASSSVMTEVLKNKSVKNTIILADFFKKLLSGSNQSNSIILNEEDKIKLNSFSSVAKFPMRAKCATLPWIAVVSAITNDAKIINIENIK